LVAITPPLGFVEAEGRVVVGQPAMLHIGGQLRHGRLPGTFPQRGGRLPVGRSVMVCPGRPAPLMRRDQCAHATQTARPGL
jgi:hypothetical protein